MDANWMKRGLAAAMLLRAATPAGAATFTEDFAWQGNHAATVNGGAVSTVHWNEDEWDIHVDTRRISAGDRYSVSVFPAASADVSDGNIGVGNTVGGTGSAGVGIMRLPAENSLGARLRNPMLITAQTPGVVEFRATRFNTSGHWWEVAITPYNGGVISGQFTSIPNTPGFVTPLDSINVLSRADIDSPCPPYPGWTFNIRVEKTINGVVDHPAGPLLQADPAEEHVLYPWRIEYYPDHISVYGDLDKNGIMELINTFNMVVPWGEVYVYLLAVSYGGGTRHPQGNRLDPNGYGWSQTGCMEYPQLRDFAWKDVHVGPVKYARTASFPKNNGTVQTPKLTGWMKQDLRDFMNVGPGFPNTEEWERNSTAAFWGGYENEGPWSYGDRDNSRDLSFDLPPAAAAGLVGARLVYDIKRYGTPSLTVNGTSVGVMPRVDPNAPSDMRDGATFWQKSIDFNPALLHAGTNTITISTPPNSDSELTAGIDRVHIELAYNTAAVPPDGIAPARPQGLRFR